MFDEKAEEDETRRSGRCQASGILDQKVEHWNATCTKRSRQNKGSECFVVLDFASDRRDGATDRLPLVRDNTFILTLVAK